MRFSRKTYTLVGLLILLDLHVLSLLDEIARTPPMLDVMATKL